MSVRLHATARARMNFANTHLMNARRFALQVRGVETAHTGQPFGSFFDDIVASTVATVLSATASLEAYVNEVAFAPVEHFPHQTPELVVAAVALAAREPPLKRAAFFATLNGKPKPDLGRKPWQEVAVLIALRNALVHFRPEWPDEQEAHDQLGARLRGKFPLSPFFEVSEPIFPRACMSYGCAKWAVESVHELIVKFADDNGWPCGVTRTPPHLELL